MMTRPGEVYMFDQGIAGKVRPFVVLAREDTDAPRDIVVAAPTTTAYRNSAYEVPIGKPKFLREQSFVNLQGVQSFAPNRLGHFLGKFDPRNMTEIKNGLRLVFEL